MALNPAPEVAEPSPDESATASLDALLALAADTLREHTDDGWVRTRSNVLARVLAVVRPSAPVLGHHAHGTYYIADVVLSGVLRRSVEPHAGARLLRVTFDTDRDHALTQVTAQVSAAFGEPLLPLADEMRRRIAAQLRSTLGIPTLADTIVHVDLVVTDVYTP